MAFFKNTSTCSPGTYLLPIALKKTVLCAFLIMKRNSLILIFLYKCVCVCECIGMKIKKTY